MTHEYGAAAYHHQQVLDWEDILCGWNRHLRNDLRKGDAVEIARTVEHIAHAANVLQKHAEKLLAATINEAAA